MDRGTYVLLIELRRDSEVLERHLGRGFYLYIGSGMNSLTGRVKRHLKRGKKIHWNVDHLTETGNVVAVLMIVGKRLEEDISRFLSERLEPVPNFGASDMRVNTNLYRIGVEEIGEVFKEIFEEFVSDTKNNLHNYE